MVMIVGGKPSWLWKSILECEVANGSRCWIASPQNRLDGRKTSTAQIGSRTQAQCIGKSPMKTSPRYLQNAAEFGDVYGAFARSIDVILRFADEAGAGIGSCA